MTDAMIDLFDGNILSELEICSPGFLYASRVTNTETGVTWRTVYRSPLVKPGERIHAELLEWLDGAMQIGETEIRTDPDMLFGAGELTLWEP